jgi:hypothetical protein
MAAGPDVRARRCRSGCMRRPAAAGNLDSGQGGDYYCFIILLIRNIADSEPRSEHVTAAGPSSQPVH